MSFLSPKQMIQELNIMPGSSIVDLGVGSGAYIYEICKINTNSKHDGKLVAVDIDGEKLKLVKDTVAFGGYMVDTLIADLEERLVLPDYAFDFILLTNTLHLIKNKSRLLDECRRILIPGGFMLLVEWRENIDLSIGPKENTIKQNDLLKLVHNAKFTIYKELEAGDYHRGYILRAN